MVSAKLLVFFSCTIVVALLFSSGNSLEGSSSLSGNELDKATELLKKCLGKLAIGGPNYKSRKIASVTKEIVPGTVYHYKVDLTNINNVVKSCDVKILLQSWMYARSVQFSSKCDKEKDIRVIIESRCDQ